jgi:hypothetical protein
VAISPLSRAGARTFPWFVFLLVIAFLFRLVFGLGTEIWFIDQHQIYLIGLKFFTTGLWPYFGPDVAEKIQLPGALQGLAVGLPLYICPIPEAPYILLNLLSFGGLCLFAWYSAKRLPNFPKWIIWTWTMTAPWVLNWSTNIDNDSYMLFGSVLFFVGFLETMPTLSLRVLSPKLANFMMGFSLFWTAQFHMSYVILFPFVLVSLFYQLKEKGNKTIPILSFFLGCMITASLILPTYLKYGFESGGVSHAIRLNIENLSSFPTVLARFLSLACCEVARFIGANTADRLAYLGQNPWTAPFTVIAFILGILQAVLLLGLGFRNKHPQKDWPSLRLLTLLTFWLVYLSFLFAIKAPAAHTYYLTLPVVMLYGFYAFSPWTGDKRFLTVAKVLLVCNIVFHIGLGVHNFQTKSLYMDRGIFVKAIQEKNYHLLGERRTDTLY